MPFLIGLCTLWVLSQQLDGLWLVDSLTTIVVASGFISSILGWGWRVRAQLRWDVAWMIGLGVFATLMLPIAMTLGPRWGLILLPVGWYKLWKLRWEWNSISLPPVHGVVIGLLGLWMVWNSQLPIVDTDGLYYHNALPKHMWLWNDLLGGELRANGSRPLIWHLPLTLVYGFGGHPAVVLVSSWTALGAWVSLTEYCERHAVHSGWWIWAVVLSSYSLMEQSMVVANNMIVLWWVWLAYREQQSKWVWGMLLGFAVAGKFTSAVVVGLIGLLGARTWKEKWGEAFIALCLVGVWGIRNALDGLHPLFPYAGWPIDMPFVWVEKYGMGREWMDFFVTPWNLLVHSEIDTFQFLGQLSPIFGVLICWWMWSVLSKKCWEEGALILGGSVFWFLGPHWIRHLLPFMGVFLIFSIRSLEITKWHHAIVALLFCVGLPSNLSPFVERQIDRWNGEVTPKGIEATEWLNVHADNGVVALFCVWTGALLDRPYVLSSVEDHTPIRHWLLSHGDQAIPALKSEGVRYVAFGPHQFYRSAYPFLSEAELERDWQRPMENLERQLQQHGRWVTRLDGVDIYLLE